MHGLALLLALGHRTGQRAGDMFASQQTVGWELRATPATHRVMEAPPVRPEPGAQLVPTSRVPAPRSPTRSWWKPCWCESAWGGRSGGLQPHNAGPQHLRSDLEFWKPGLKRSRPGAWPWVVTWAEEPPTAPRSGLELDSKPSTAPQAGSRDSQGRPSTAYVYRCEYHSSRHP